jgi:predicted DNA-binding transcriptional regulator AlpA
MLKVSTSPPPSPATIPDDPLAGPDVPRLSVNDIARLVSAGERTIWRWLESGILPQPDLRIGKVIRWKPSSVRIFFKTQESK